MIDITRLGQLAAELYKQAITTRRGRAGRTVKGPSMQKQLHAAGQPKMNTPGIVGYPRGQAV